MTPVPATALTRSLEVVDVLDQLEGVCKELWDNQEETEHLAYRLGCLMRDIQNKPSIFTSLVDDTGRRLYGSFDDFVLEFICPKVRRHRAMLMKYLAVVKRNFTEQEVGTLGITAAYRIGTFLPEASSARADLVQAVIAETVDGGSRKESAERLIAQRNNWPIEAVQDDWLKFKSAEENVVEARRLIAQWLTVHQVKDEVCLIVDILNRAWIEREQAEAAGSIE